MELNYPWNICNGAEMKRTMPAQNDKCGIHLSSPLAGAPIPIRVSIPARVLMGSGRARVMPIIHLKDFAST